MKKIIYLLIIVIVCIIYFFNNDKKINILEFSTHSYKNYINNDGISKYNTGYVEKNTRITDLYNDIINNKKIQIGDDKYVIKNSIIRADYIIVNVGINEFKTIKTYNEYEEYINDLDKLFTLLRKYSKEKIIYINENNIEKYDKSQLIYICKKSNIKYINLYGLNESEIYKKIKI